MKITVKGIITSVGQLKQGVSQSGNEWAIQEFIVTDSNNEIVCFEVFGKEHISNFSIGQSVTIDCNLQVREWNGKYFTSIRYIAPMTNSQQLSNPTPIQSTPQPQSQFQSQPQSQPTQQIPQAQSQVTYAQPYVAPQQQQHDDLPF
jgi:hypothetical protein